MPNNVTARIRSALKKSRWVLGVVVVLVLAVGFLVPQFVPDSTPKPEIITLTFSPERPAKNGSTSPATYYLTPALTDKDQLKGLSNTPHLDQNQGMLFAYKKELERCFWMKDMHYPLDILWVNAAKEVTHIETNVSPKTYPETFCATGRYVIELNAGAATKHNVRVGQKLHF